MATIRQAIDIKASVHVLYNQLSQFEDYPRFMEDVEDVMQVDETHLHWTVRMANRPVEWDAEISEQEADRCIAWHNTSGPTNAGKVEVQEVGPDSSRVIFTLETEPQQTPSSMVGNQEQEIAQRLRHDLTRLKEYIESSGELDGQTNVQATGMASDQMDGLAADQNADSQVERGSADHSSVPSSSYAAGSEGLPIDEEPITSVSPHRTPAATTSAQQRVSGSSQPDASQHQASAKAGQARPDVGGDASTTAADGTDAAADAKGRTTGATVPKP